MAIITRTAIEALVQSLLIDNITEDISPADMREVLTAFKESCLNLLDDAAFLNLRSLTTRPYAVGEAYIYSGKIYQVAIAHTGGASPDLSKVTILFDPATFTIETWVSGTEYTTNTLVFYKGTIIRRDGAPTTSFSPETEAGWTFFNKESQDITITSPGSSLVLNARGADGKNFKVTSNSSFTFDMQKMRTGGTYYILIKNTVNTTITATCTNSYLYNAATREVFDGVVTIEPFGVLLLTAVFEAPSLWLSGIDAAINNPISNNAYDATWNGDLEGASKNALYQKFENDKAYFEDKISQAIEGIKPKTPVDVLLTTDIDITASHATLDGETTFDGFRVALAGQTDATENGIYVTDASGDLTRAEDADTGEELEKATFLISIGTHANETWGVSNRPIELGVDTVTIVMRNAGATPAATTTVEGAVKLLNDSQVDTLIASSSAPTETNRVINGRQLWRWIANLWTKAEITLGYDVAQRLFYTQQNGTKNYHLATKHVTITQLVADNGLVSALTVRVYAFSEKTLGIITNDTADTYTLLPWSNSGSINGGSSITIAPNEMIVYNGSELHMCALKNGTGGGGGGGATNLSWNPSPTGGTVNSDTGTDANLTLVDAINAGLVSPSMKSTWDGKQDNLGYTPENTSNKGAANGYAPLGSDSKVPSVYLPSYVDDVLEYANLAALPGTGETGKIYVTLDNNYQYRWSGSAYVQLVASPGTTDALTEGSTNLYFTAARVLATVISGFSAAVGVVANTDTILVAINKIVGNMGLLAPKDSPTFTTKTTHNYATASKIAVFNASKELVSGTISESDITTQQITITTSVNITTATTDSGGVTQNNRHVIIDNSTNAISFTLNGSVTASYLKHGTGAITVTRGSGRQMYYNGSDVATATWGGAVGSTLTITAVGTRDYISIVNI